MQQEPRTNRDRTGKTRASLLQAARALFVEKGYAGTSTPEIVAKAGITRGALYHHFDDKRALFRAIVHEEAQAVLVAIETRTATARTASEALLTGSTAYLDAMAVPGRTRLLLVEGPAVLGTAEMTKLDEENGAGTLRVGLEAALAESGNPANISVVALTALLSASFDRAALAIDTGADPQEYRATVVAMIARLTGAE